ncbi:MAG: cupin domain-containing protein [Candidatus Cybelea sp.]
MLQPLSIPGIYLFAHLLPEPPFVAASHFLVTEDGNVLVDPLPFDAATHEAITRLGGISCIVVMSPDRARTAQELAERYGAPVVARPGHRECIASGVVAIRLPDQWREDEFVLSLPERRTVVAGDSLAGAPAGALAMADAGAYADQRKAALGLRAILRENPQRLLLSRGHSLLSGAYEALYELLYARAGAEVLRINLDELEFLGERAEHSDQPTQFACLDAEVGFAIGARKLGYRVSTLDPGQRFCPLHGHAREEELFFVIDGEPSVRTLSGTIRCRKGDFIALPVGESGTHQLLNESGAPATVLLLARAEDVEACYYPDSDKLLLGTLSPFIKGADSIIVRASPTLDYFDGET